MNPSAAEEGKQEADKKKQNIGDKDELPTAIIIRDVPKELFGDEKQKENFTSMFQQIASEPIQIHFLKSFQRVRIIFEKPEHATAAKLLVEHHSFNGAKMKAFFAKNIKMSSRVDQDEKGHLKLPPLEKQFLISPPSSPPVGWVQHAEMAPVVCDFDLMARLASLTVDDKYELFEGDNQQRRPSIVVTPCLGESDKSALIGRGAPIGGGEGSPSDSENSDYELPARPLAKVPLPHTPRPPIEGD